MPAPVRYVHVLTFKAVHQLLDERTGNPEHPIHGHRYTVELGFEDTQGFGLMLPERVTTAETVQVLADFITDHMDGADLTHFGFRTTPLGIAWYLFERLAEDQHTAADLTDITIIVDDLHRHTFRPLPAEQ